MADAKTKKAQQAITAHLTAQAISLPSLTGGWLMAIFLNLILPVLDSLLTLAAPTIIANPKLKAVCVAVDRELDIILGESPTPATAKPVTVPVVIAEAKAPEAEA